MSERTDSARYRFAPLEEVTLLAGLRLGQLLIISAGSGVVIAAIRLGGSAVLGTGTVVFFGAMVLALGRFGGRSADVWTRLLATWVWTWLRDRVVANRTSRCAALPIHTFSTKTGGHARPNRSRHVAVPAPRPLARVRITSVDDGGRHIGVLRDGAFPWVTAVLRVHGRAFALLGPEDQQHRLAAWASILNGLAHPGTGVRRLQWIERAAPEQYQGASDAMRARVSSRGAEASSLNMLDPFTSYAELLAAAPEGMHEHDVLLVVQIDISRAAKAGRVSAAELLVRTLRHLAARLREDDLEVVGALGPAALESAIAAAFCPFTKPPGASTADPAVASRRSHNAPPAGGPWPSATSPQWSCYRTDSAWHATFWIAQWPQTAVGPDFLAPLLLHSRAARSVSVVCEPLDADQGLRRAQADRVNRLADERLRQGRGFLTTARHLRQRTIAAEREAQLADGHAEVRFCGYITVSATSKDQLEHDCAEILQSARRARLELRRLYGQQDLAFTYTLPLCRGLDV